MKKYLIGFGLVAIAVFLMILPYILRQDSRQVIKTEQITEAMKIDIDVSDFKFTPSVIKVKKGANVQWINKDSDPHTITANISGPASEILEKDEIYNFTFNEVGVFNYYCKLHPFMKGVIEVVD